MITTQHSHPSTSLCSASVSLLQINPLKSGLIKVVEAPDINLFYLIENWKVKHKEQVNNKNGFPYMTEHSARWGTHFFSNNFFTPSY